MPQSRRFRRSFFVAAGVVLVAVLAYSVGAGANRRAAGSPAFQSLQQLELRTLDGHTWRLADYRGSVVLVNFWATWCPPCRMETPGLVAVANEFQPKGLAVVGVNMDEGGEEAVREFAGKYRMPYPVGILPQDTALSGQIDSLPTTFLIDRNGQIATAYTGMVNEADLRHDVERLLAGR